MESKIRQAVLIPVKDLVSLERNPRTISESEFEKLCRSMEKDKSFLNVRPLLVNDFSGQFVVYAGNQKLKAAIRLGMDYLPCIVEALSEDEQTRRMLKDNVHEGEFDASMLLESFDTDFLRDEIGFNEVHLSKMKEEKEEMTAKLSQSPPELEFITFKGHSIPLSKEKADSLLQKIEAYIDHNGTLYGFVKYIMKNHAS